MPPWRFLLNSCGDTKIQVTEAPNSPTVSHLMHTASMLPPAITMLVAIAIACGSTASAQQAPAAIPFARGVLITVIPSKPAGVKGGDWDDKMQRIGVRLKFANTDIRQTFEGYTATISVFAQSVLDGKVRKVLLQEQVPVSLPPRKTQEHECKEITTRFDKTGSKFGYFYDGWIVVVKDAEGKVVQVKSTSPSMEKLPEQAAKIAMNGCYNSKLEPAGDPGRGSTSSQ